MIYWDVSIRSFLSVSDIRWFIVECSWGIPLGLQRFVGRSSTPQGLQYFRGRPFPSLTQSRLITLVPSLIARRWVGRQTQWWPRHKAIYFRWSRSFFVCCLAHRGSIVVFFFFFCSSVPVVLFDIPGISRCRSPHVSVESSSLFHHSIYLWFICFPWWSIDVLENLQADRTTMFWTMTEADGEAGFP